MTSSSGRTAWGATKKGRRGVGLWGPAVGIGVVVSAVMAGLALMVSSSPEPGLLAVVTAAVVLPVGVALGWGIMVDRSSISGAVDRPEESVESRWWDQAASGALMDGFAMIGLGAGTIALTGVEVAADTVLMALWVLLSVDMGIRYLVARRAG